MKYITEKDLDALELGCALLGSGGGSNPSFGKKLAYEALLHYGPVPLIDVEDLEKDALITPVSFMGAPLISGVVKPTGQEFSVLLSLVEKQFGRKPTALIAAEIGGSNAFTPLLCAGVLNLPIIDGDTIGRAFPELPMATTTLFAISATPAFITEPGAHAAVTIHTHSREHSLEQLTRHLAIGFGSKAALISDIMTGTQAKKACIRGSFSKAIKLGHTILRAREQNKNPIEALVTNAQAQLICSGVITQVARSLVGGFVVGHFTLKTAEAKTISVHFKNENLIVYEDKQPLATTPDIIIPVREHDAQPLTVELLEKGIQVTILSFKSDPIWYTPEGLALVGPRAFGFDTLLE
jgi:uncharacterized protein